MRKEILIQNIDDVLNELDRMNCNECPLDTMCDAHIAHEDNKLGLNICETMRCNKYNLEHE